jgi:cytochrome c peroxidase
MMSTGSTMSAASVSGAFVSRLAGFDVRQLKSFCQTQQLDVRACVEKLDLLEKARSVPVEKISLQAVRRDIAQLLRDPSHDDGSYGPLLLRFAWHNCGTYCAKTNTGGSNGGTMRFPVESNDPENTGLGKAKQLLAPVVEKYPWLSTADIWVLAGYVAIEEMGGPPVPFAFGRRDFSEGEAKETYGPSLCPYGDGAFNPGKSRLPAADLGSDPKAPRGCPMHVKEKPTIDAIRGTFGRMGFIDRETVCLIILGHQFGRCHLENSGYQHPWYAFDPTHWNVYGPGGLGYMSLYRAGVARGQLKEVTTPKGKRQYQMSFGYGDPFMMLPTDMALWWDENYREHVVYYDTHRLEFRRDAAIAWKKLTELGCDEMLQEEHGVEFEDWRRWRGH